MHSAPSMFRVCSVRIFGCECWSVLRLACSNKHSNFSDHWHRQAQTRLVASRTATFSATTTPLNNFSHNHQVGESQGVSSIIRPRDCGVGTGLAREPSADPTGTVGPPCTGTFRRSHRRPDSAAIILDDAQTTREAVHVT